MADIKICAQCGAPFVGSRCPNCGGHAESETDMETDGCTAGTSHCSNCGGSAGNGTSVLDAPKCPWCGKNMINITRSTPEGWM